MRLNVKVTPGASKTRILGWQEDILKIAIHAPADKGKANSALVIFLAEILQLPQRDIVLVQGAASRLKVLEFPLSAEQLKERLPL